MARHTTVIVLFAVLISLAYGGGFWDKGSRKWIKTVGQDDGDDHRRDDYSRDDIGGDDNRDDNGDDRGDDRGNDNDTDARIANNKHDLDHADEDIRHAEAHIKDAEKDVDANQREINKNRKKINDNDEEIETNDSEIKRLRKFQAKLREDLNEFVEAQNADQERQDKASNSFKLFVAEFVMLVIASVAAIFAYMTYG